MGILDVNVAAGVCTPWVCEAPWKHWPCEERAYLTHHFLLWKVELGRMLRPWRRFPQKTGRLVLTNQKQWQMSATVVWNDLLIKEMPSSYQWISALGEKPKEAKWVICFLVFTCLISGVPLHPELHLCFPSLLSPPVGNRRTRSTMVYRTFSQNGCSASWLSQRGESLSSQKTKGWAF